MTNSCENCSPARFEGWRGLGLQSRLIAGVSPIAAIAAAPPVGFPRLVQYSGAMAPIPVYGGQGQCQPAGPHILLCTAHIIQPRTSLPPWLLDFQLLSSVTASPYWSQLSDKHTFRTNGKHDVGQKGATNKQICKVYVLVSSPFNAILHPNSQPHSTTDPCPSPLSPLRCSGHST